MPAYCVASAPRCLYPLWHRAWFLRRPPSIAQGAGNYPVTICVADNGIPSKIASEGISITVTPSLPSPWANQNIGAVGLVGSAFHVGGTTWTQIGSNRNITMAANVCIGIGVCSKVTTSLNDSTFSNVTAVP